MCNRGQRKKTNTRVHITVNVLHIHQFPKFEIICFNPEMNSYGVKVAQLQMINRTNGFS